MRAAGLGAGAGQAMAAERLHADDGADHVAVDIDVADLEAIDHVLDRVVDARMDAERQAITGALDRSQHTVKPVGAIAHQMQHGPEHFFRQLASVRQLKNMWPDEIAGGADTPKIAAGLLLLPRRMTLPLLLFLRANHPADHGVANPGRAA